MDNVIDLEMMRSSIVEYFEGVDGWDEESVAAMSDQKIQSIYKELFPRLTVQRLIKGVVGIPTTP